LGEEGGSAVGLRVTDVARGPLGVIVEERAGAAQTLWVVDGPFGEILIPAVDEFVHARDEAAVQVSLPEGLLGLNA
jgi:16S rRNA processing protein RimM